MAIAKIEKRSATVWGTHSIVMASVGAVLALISLFLLWGALRSFMVRTNYTEAVFKHDSNRRQDVKSYAEKARSWGNHPESTELLAKVLVESNQLDAAEKLYVQMANGPRRGMGLCGQGIILLRRADGEKELKKVAELARKAKDKMTEAKSAEPGLIEAQIGAATADLLIGVKTKDPAKVNSARGEFAKIYRSLSTSEDVAANVTREGYVDLFVGLARSNASTTKYSPEALSFAGAARRYLPASLKLHAMELALQAQQMVESPPATAEIRAARTFERLKQLRDQLSSARDPKAMEAVGDSWFALALASAAVFARAGTEQDSRDSKALLDLAQQRKGGESLMAEVLEASIAMETVRNAEKNWNKRATNYSLANQQLKKIHVMKELQDESRVGLRATILNNLAFFEEDYAAQGSGETRYKEAVNYLKAALEAEQKAGLTDGSYEVRRNLAVIQRRRGNAEEAAEHFAAAQRLAAGRTEDFIRQDLDSLQKHFAGSP